MSSKGRTELKVCASGTEEHEEADFDISNCPAPPQIQEKNEKLISETKKIEFFSNRFFAVLEVAKRCRRLEFWQRVALDFPDEPERPTDDQNSTFSKNFRENFEFFFLI